MSCCNRGKVRSLSLWTNSAEPLIATAGLSAAGGLKVHPAMVDRWQQVLGNYDTTRYKQNGIRAADEQQPAFSCRIRHFSFSYKTGERYPTPDPILVLLFITVC